ncbi:Lysophospholipase, alpha-beta hydrolase superfamily [Collimonas sp. OK242]|jgi:pimeloyl-ACP methyl ester carboxylesterase|uniref:alpha/beta fold hydrolase n=1 Tax=Collimonas sp. OK242 TaxID=1798195 RepID=UPI00089B96D4|nr:alpha/beta fold hydrolase [Collimonas sp. OK242]SDX27643.1 Lysophospholipase, alpha-beta hydrolase superfamily [Collimonas sp. OK242]
MDMHPAASQPLAAKAHATSKTPVGNLFKLLRTGVRLSQFVAPNLTHRIAARLFCTPIPGKLAARHLIAPPNVRVESLSFERASITLYHWPAPENAPQLLMTHGWAGWGLQMTALADALSAAGWAVVLIDQPAHGRSSAWSSTLPQFVRALAYAAAHLGRVQALLGHSMGGAAACIAAANGLGLGLALDKLVLIAAPVSMLQATRDYALAFGIRENVRASMVSYLEAREGMLFERMGAAQVAPRVGTPTLVIHDCDDSIVPFRAAQLLMEKLPDAQLLSTRNLGHRRLLKDPGVIEATRQFLRLEKTAAA